MKIQLNYVYNKVMTKKEVIQALVAVLLFAGLITGCNPQAAPTSDTTAGAIPAIEETSATTPAEMTPAPAGESDMECPGQEINPLGESIAADYDFTTYNQVMTWFCEGAAFEDILVALETQAVTDEPAGEMLQMLAEGWTWENIWLLVGLEN